MLAKFFIAFRFDKCINFITVEKLLSASSIINNPEKLNLYVYGIYKKKKNKRDFHICAERLKVSSKEISQFNFRVHCISNLSTISQLFGFNSHEIETPLYNYTCN